MLLVLDNYDSFVHNLARYFRILGHPTSVVRSDQITPDECRRLQPHAIILSPGPHDPADAGCSVDVIRRLGTSIPILGICLGHQAIGAAFGASIIRCGPVHGSDSLIRHHGNQLFADCPNPMRVGRYHSLAVDPESIPSELTITARTDDGIVMGISHRTHPIHGLQFHPESVLTPEGDRTLKNFLNLADRFHQTPASADTGPPIAKHDTVAKP
ncbi:Aminodeoxychorismate/anthranilate synthase component 2 [Crateriforma conspicua]|uniref:Aminodeoxychorismate/anthranilate synthase component 2 n=1 Tax=Crateriforma conspicua TaxID=2527996 RepID=A0A5C6FSQ5_9PLAN|nr:aminodeoxychorismate/anthranilate synthase component II [Crateriforma conspicua]TWU65391.1 Aminodeoxychorismate/anthranilate synthase component 2 [Crateriforma conspicua]